VSASDVLFTAVGFMVFASVAGAFMYWAITVFRRRPPIE